MEDKLLVKKSRQGCVESFRQIYDKYRDDLLILAVAMLNDTHAAQDVLHDVFLAFAQSLDGFKLSGSLRSYLATCVANRSRNWRKTKHRQTVAIEAAASVASDIEGPFERIVINEELFRLSDALAELPTEQREVIVLHMHGQMSLPAIARAQGTSANTVKSRYRYGIDKLRSMLDEGVKK